MRDLITTILEDSIRVKRQAIEAQMDALLAAADMLVTCVASGHKILLFGNGGSAADAQHLAAEFVNRFQIERHPLPALALTTDTSIITSIGNDYTFEQIFSKQIQALGKRGDVAWGLSTSGNSPNVLAGMRAARELDPGSPVIADRLARLLAQHRSALGGIVRLIFQPAEEGPGGAEPMIAEATVAILVCIDTESPEPAAATAAISAAPAVQLAKKTCSRRVMNEGVKTVAQKSVITARAGSGSAWIS